MAAECRTVAAAAHRILAAAARRFTGQRQQFVPVAEEEESLGGPQRAAPSTVRTAVRSAAARHVQALAAQELASRPPRGAPAAQARSLVPAKEARASGTCGILRAAAK